MATWWSVMWTKIAIRLKWNYKMWMKIGIADSLMDSWSFRQLAIPSTYNSVNFLETLRQLFAIPSTFLQVPSTFFKKLTERPIILGGAVIPSTCKSVNYINICFIGVQTFRQLAIPSTFGKSFRQLFLGCSVNFLVVPSTKNVVPSTKNSWRNCKLTERLNPLAIWSHSVNLQFRQSFLVDGTTKTYFYKWKNKH